MIHDLKPFPFCGGKGVLVNSGNHWTIVYYRVVCKRNCCFQGTFFSDPVIAVEEWNRRAYDENG